VAGGPGSFVFQIDSFEGFAEAITRKLIAEIASGESGDATAWR
jgi:hypothetical protein